MRSVSRGLVWGAVWALFAGSAGALLAAEGQSLASQVQIRRTQYGVPHIQAETLEGAALGFGYCQAEDHWPNILRGIVGVRSQLAETFGPDQAAGDGKNLESDLFNRQFRVYQRAIDTYHKLDPDYRAMCEGFAAGLNLYVDQHRVSLPAWTPKVTGHDVAAYGFSGVMRFAFNRSDLIKDFIKAKTKQPATARLERSLLDTDTDDDRETGSNMWAFAPSRSASGRTLLVGNPHQPWAPVSTYYEAHLTVPGKLNFYGSTFIGRPILTSGWNECLGWSHTVNYQDLEEIYELKLDPAQADHYLFDGDSPPLVRDDVEIKVKDGPPQKQTFWHTPLGPVILRTAEHVYVLRSACYENYRAYEQWLRMTQAKNYAEFRQAIEINQIPMFNICYADGVGNIFYIWNGTVPNLPHPAHKAEAVPAARTADVWTAFHATGELPQLFNPPGGYVQNCNSPPFLTNLRAPLDPAKYPPHFRPNDLSLRTQHSLALIDNDKKYTLEELCDLKHSPKMLLADRVKDDLIAAVRASQPTSEVEAALEVLAKWDNTVTADSRGGTLFEEWAERYFPKGVGKYAVAWSDKEPMSTPRGLGDNARAVKNFMEALAEMNKKYSRIDISWGEAHRLRKGTVDLPLSGGSGLMGCFRVLAFRQDGDGKQVANSGDSFVFAVEFSQPPKGYSVLAYSESEIEGSPHFADQAVLFSAGTMKRAAFTEAEIQGQLVRSYRPDQP